MNWTKEASQGLHKYLDHLKAKSMNKPKTYATVLENEREFQRLKVIHDKLEEVWDMTVFTGDKFEATNDGDDYKTIEIKDGIEMMQKSLQEEMTKLSVNNQSLMKAGLSLTGQLAIL